MISLTTVVIIISFLSNVALALDRIFNGSSKIKNEVIDTYKERNGQLEATLKDHQNQINRQGNDLARLTGVVEEKEKLIKSLNETILNRNPNLEKTLAAINTFLELIYKQGIVLATKTDEQTVMIKSQVRREDGIDISTEAETGKVMRRDKHNK